VGMNPSTAPSYAALADLLQDPAARDALIAQLRELAGTGASAPSTPPSSTASNSSTAQNSPSQAAGDSVTTSTVASRQGAAGTTDAPSARPQGIGGHAQAFAAGLGRDFSEAARLVRDVFTGRQVADDVQHRWSELSGFLMVLAALLVAYGVFRSIAVRMFRRLDTWVGQLPAGKADELRVLHGRFGPLAFNVDKLSFYRKAGGVLGALLIDAAAIVLAGFAGYLAAGALPFPFDRGERLGLAMVNAFLAVELVKTISRAVFAKRHPKLRLWPMSEESAAYWYGWLARI